MIYLIYLICLSHVVERLSNPSSIPLVLRDSSTSAVKSLAIFDKKRILGPFLVSIPPRPPPKRLSVGWTCKLSLIMRLAQHSTSRFASSLVQKSVSTWSVRWKPDVLRPSIVVGVRWSMGHTTIYGHAWHECTPSHSVRPTTIVCRPLCHYCVQAFMYAYSLREKTRAARRLEDDVPREIKQRRLQAGRPATLFFGLVDDRARQWGVLRRRPIRTLHSSD